jgi:hypothetical protein
MEGDSFKIVKYRLPLQKKKFGIEEPNIQSSVATITGLAVQRQNLEYTTKEGNILFKDSLRL